MATVGVKGLTCACKFRFWSNKHTHRLSYWYRPHTTTDYKIIQNMRGYRAGNCQRSCKSTNP